MKVFFRRIFFMGIYFFAIVGFLFLSVFFAVRFQWTNVAGAVDAGSDQFEQLDAILTPYERMNDTNKIESGKIDTLDQQISTLQKNRDLVSRNFCSYAFLSKLVPGRSASVWHTSEIFHEESIKAKMLYAVASALGKENELTNNTEECLKNEGWKSVDEEQIKTEGKDIENVFAWTDSGEWDAIKKSVVKDIPAIEKASKDAGIEPRLLVSSLIVEQLRLFHSQRELFKKFFEPLKILGNANKISLGVMGIKEATAVQIEQNLRNISSPYYLGPDFESLLDYDGEVTGDKRYNRLTSEANQHYYSYLYGALYLRQMLSQWGKAGYSIEYRPEIVGTLYNVGFPQSHPNAHPKVGGSQINVGERPYSFGRLAYEFYYSEELLAEFPFVTK